MTSLSYNSEPLVLALVSSPFSKLPAELQLEIFTLCLHQEEYPLLRKGNFPWVFLSVCRRWRELCISASHLWSRFEVDINRCCTVSSDVPDAPLIDVVKRCIRSSNAYPLSVRMTYFPHEVPGKALNPTCARIISLLLAHAGRWHRVNFSLPSPCIEPLFQSTPQHLESLKVLTLDVKGGWSFNLSLNIMCLGIRWGQITDLDLNLDNRHLLSLDSWLAILSQTRKLTTCTVNCHCDFTDDSVCPDGPDIIQVVELPELRHLHFVVQGKRHDDSERNFMSFLYRIHCTALKSLQVEWLLPVDLPPVSIPAPHHAMLVSFLDRLGPRLETFRLSYLPLTPAQLVDCLLVLPHVVNLGLRFSLSPREASGPTMDVFFEALILGINDGRERQILLPSLRSLKLECCGSLCYSFPHVILTFLNQRRRKLKEFSLFTRNRIDELEDESVVAAWKKRGIQVYFRSLLLA